MQRPLQRIINPSSWSIRWRLTLWYLSGIALILSISGALAYYGFRSAIIADTDRSLTIKTTEIILAITNGESLKPKNMSGISPLSPAEIASLTPAAFGGLQFDSTGDPIYMRLIFANSGQEVGSSKNVMPHAFIAKQLRQYSSVAKFGRKPFFVGSDEDNEIRVMLSAVPRSPYVLQLATPWARNERILYPMMGTIIWIEVCFLAISAIGCWILIGRTMRPINELVLEAGKLRGDRLEPEFVAIRTYGEDEIGHLVQALNAMMARVHRSVEIQKQFTSDASHDLRTPLTILRGELEFALARERSPKEYQQAVATAIQAADRLIRIVSDLDELALADAQENSSANYLREYIDVADMCQAVLHSHLPQAQLRNVELKFVCDIKNQASRVTANPVALERAIANLVDNAIKYNVTGGNVELSVLSESGKVRIEIVDSGIGISDDDRPFIFDRFYRGDKSRASTSMAPFSSSSGLGLSIAQYVISSNGGSLEVTSIVNQGSRFTITLPSSVEPSLALI